MNNTIKRLFIGLAIVFSGLTLAQNSPEPRPNVSLDRMANDFVGRGLLAPSQPVPGGGGGGPTNTTCSAGPVTWTVGGNTCNGSIASPVASGSTSPQVTDSTGPTTGSSTFTCNNGTLNQNAGATCAAAATSPGWCVNVVTSTYTFPASSIPLLPAATPIEYLLAGGGSGGSGPGTSCTNCTMASQRVTGSFTPNAEFYVYVGGGGGGWTTTQPVSGGGGGAGWAGGGGGGYGSPSVLVQTGSSGAGGSTAITYSQTAAATAVAFAPGLQGSFGTGGTPTGGGTNTGGAGSLGGTAGTRFDGGNAGRTGATNVTYFPAGGRGPNGSNGGGSSGANGSASGQGGGGFGGGGAGSGVAGGLGAMAMAPMVMATGTAITVPPDVGRANGSGGANGGHGGNAGIAVLRYRTPTGQCVPGFTNVPSPTTPPPSQTSCSGAVSWTVGGTTCSGTLPATVANGATSGTVNDNTAPTTGSSTFTCNNGTSTQNSGATCSSTTSTSCAAQTLSWTVSGVNCSGNVATTNAGSSATVNSVSSNSGSATFQCNPGGTFSAQPNAGATCAAGREICYRFFGLTGAAEEFFGASGTATPYPAGVPIEYLLVGGGGGGPSVGRTCPNCPNLRAPVVRGSFIPDGRTFGALLSGGGGSYKVDPSGIQEQDSGGGGGAGLYGGGGGGVSGSGSSAQFSAGGGGSTGLQYVNAEVIVFSPGMPGISSGGQSASGGSNVQGVSVYGGAPPDHPLFRCRACGGFSGAVGRPAEMCEGGNTTQGGNFRCSGGNSGQPGSIPGNPITMTAAQFREQMEPEIEDINAIQVPSLVGTTNFGQVNGGHGGGPGIGLLRYFKPSAAACPSTFTLGRTYPASKPGCPRQRVSWVEQGRQCAGDTQYDIAHNGRTENVSDSNFGLAQFTCDNGALVVRPGARCSQSNSCVTPGTYSWTVGGNTCSVTAGTRTTIPDGASTGALNDTTAPNLGSASFTCDQRALVLNPGATCNP